MSINRFFVHPVTVVTPAERADSYGNAVADWASAQRRDALGWFAQDTTTEVIDGRETITSDWSLSLPATDPITARDRIERNGRTYTIVGEVQPGETPAGTHHLVVHLRTFTG